MEIIIHINQKKFDTDYKAALAEYIKRLSPFCRMTLAPYRGDIPVFKKGSKRFFVVPGKSTVSSPALANQIHCLNLEGYSCLEYVIGELSSDTEAEVFHLSSFTMEQELTAVVLAEQLYRAYTILNNMTYHK